MESCQLFCTCIFVSGLCALWTCQRVERRPDIDRYSWFSDSFNITSFFEKEGEGWDFNGLYTVSEGWGTVEFILKSTYFAFTT